MASKSKSSPIFPMPEPQHFSDYGFDPQLDYFQVLEEAMKHKKDTSSSSSSSRSTIDSFHFKLQKPIISKDHHHHHHHHNDKINKIHKKKKRKWWWANALLLFKWKGRGREAHAHSHVDDDDDDVHYARAQAFRASISGPVYITDSRSGSTTPYRTSSGPISVGGGGGCTPTRKGDAELPYLSLRELNLEQKQRVSASSMPIYMVT